MALTLSHCSVAMVPVELLVPAEISIPRNIQNVGIINHSMPTDRGRFSDLVEGFLTRESIFADQIGADYCLKGLAEKLADSPRLTPVIIPSQRLTRSSVRSLPGMLSWDRVEQICQQYRVDALIALEHFDSNIHLRKRRQEKRNKKDDSIRVTHRLKLFIQVNSGWRIYHPSTRSVIDAQIYSDEKTWSASGKTLREARRRLPNKRDAINEAGLFSGIRYGERISPTWVTISRSYFTKGCPEFEIATRAVKVGDWQNAESLWKQVLENPDPKLRSRAAYNLAFAAEVQGDLERALELARVAYSRYGSKKAFYYIQDLQTRIQNKEILREQMD